MNAFRKPADGGIDIASAFAPFEKLGQVRTRRDDRWLYVESDGIPDHPLMVGIRAWQQQVPLPQKYVGDNAWQIPLHPVQAKEPAPFETLRHWHNKDGESLGEAEFVGFKDGKAILKNESGELRIRVGQLSKEDRDWVHRYMKWRRQQRTDK